jgi:hypothetical protein
VSDSGDYVIIPDISVTFDITTDLIGSEPASKDIQCWIDSDQTPIAGFLVDTGATFFSYGVKAGDVVYNTTDITQTTVKTTATVDGANLELNDDIFVSGENYKIHVKRPAGLGTYKANPGAVYNNASSNIDDSWYTQIQDEKEYTIANGDFTITLITAGGLNSEFGSIRVRQVGNRWHATGNINYGFTASASGGISISGIVFQTIPSGAVWNTVNLARYSLDLTPTNMYASSGSNSIVITTASTSGLSLEFSIPLDKKPTFHH